MIVFLYGEDSYRRQERKNFYAAEFQKKYGIPALRIDVSDADGFLKFESEAKGQSLFGARKLLVVENLFTAEPKKILPLLRSSLESKESGLLVSEDKKPVKTLELLLKKPVITEEFAKLKDKAWFEFVQGLVKTTGAKLTPEALAFLAEAYTGDSWGVVTEMRKLSGLKKTLSVSDLVELGVETEKDYWALVNGLKGPRASSRLTALQIIFSMNEPPAKVFNILSSLWTARVGDFAAYDRAVKFGRMDYEEALTDLALTQ